MLVFLFDGAVRLQKNDGCLSRIYGIPFGEKRIAAQTGDFLVRNRGKNTRRSVSFLRRRARPLADTGKLKNLGKGEKRQFLLREKKTRNARYSKNTRRQNEKKPIHVYTTPFLTTVSLSRDGNFFFLSGVREQNICLFSPTRRGDPFVKETPGKKEEKTTAGRGGSSVGPTFFADSLFSLSVCVCVCVCVCAGAMLLWFLIWYDDI